MRFVGKALLYEALGDGEHFGDVVGGFGEFLRGDDVELALVAEEPVGVELGDLGGGFALGYGGGDDFVAALLQDFLAHMADVGDVLDVDDLQAVELEGAAYPVGHQVGSEVADVGVAVHGWAAGVHFDDAALYGAHFVNSLGESVV